MNKQRKTRYLILALILMILSIAAGVFIGMQTPDHIIKINLLNFVACIVTDFVFGIGVGRVIAQKTED
jgi:hypothetical protein